jgi:Asp-tRNA(Asn)/Glu-tRNA(Gln) amidotransferase A subunit family amidase
MEHNYYHEIHDCSTGETTIVPLTEEELAQLEAAQAEVTAQLEAEAQKAAEEAARLSAKLAIYAKLGLTEEEINTLIS